MRYDLRSSLWTVPKRQHHIFTWISLALHQSSTDRERDDSAQRLDHIDFFQRYAEDVDHWFEFLQDHDVKMRTEPRTHRDGARSFYCYDPDGTVIQIIHHPPVADWEQMRGVN